MANAIVGVLCTLGHLIYKEPHKKEIIAPILDDKTEP